jgi:tRNA-dihydrouridine synthase
VFLRHVPELANNARTPTGLPVQVQLLGGDPGRMAEAAVVAHQARATAIDINFGCPANTVNRHDGGATRNHRCQSLDEMLDLTFDWFETRTHFRVQSSVYTKSPGK